MPHVPPEDLGVNDLSVQLALAFGHMKEEFAEAGGGDEPGSPSSGAEKAPAVDTPASGRKRPLTRRDLCLHLQGINRLSRFSVYSGLLVCRPRRS